MLNSYQALGNIGKDPDFKPGNENTQAVLDFSVAVQRGKDKNGNQKDPYWAQFKAFGKQAETINQYFSKGAEILITDSEPVTEIRDKEDGTKSYWSYYIVRQFSFTKSNSPNYKEEKFDKSDSSSGSW